MKIYKIIAMSLGLLALAVGLKANPTVYSLSTMPGSSVTSVTFVADAYDDSGCLFSVDFYVMGPGESDWTFVGSAGLNNGGYGYSGRAEFVWTVTQYGNWSVLAVPHDLWDAYWDGAASNTFRVDQPLPATGDSITTSANPVVGSSYEVYANNVRNAVRVLFPTWTDANGQDELIWYEGVYDGANNRWKRTVQLSEHNNESGDYTTHVYAMSADGTWYYLFGTTVNVTYQAPVSKTLYKIESVNSGRVLDVMYNSTDNGARICQWDYVGYASQQWYLEEVGNGSYVIRSVKSERVLDVMYDSTDNGARICQWDYVGLGSQQWFLDDVGNGSYVIRNVNSGRVLDVMYDSVDNGAQICQWDYVGASSQQWRLIPVGQQSSLTVPLYRWERYIEAQPGGGLSKKWGKDYWYTTVPDAYPEGYTYAGVACRVFSSQVPGSIPLYSSYSAATGVHFYTTNFDEIPSSEIYTYEGVACYVLSEAKDGAVPFYRNYHGGINAMGGHLYTVDPSAEALGAQSMDVSYWIWKVSKAEKDAFAAMHAEKKDADDRSLSASTSPSGDITRYLSMGGIWDSVVNKWNSELNADRDFEIQFNYQEVTVKLWTPPFVDEGIQCYVFRP